ncbi:hypothetical protein GCM10007923_64270 [Shinella yambaruensis]|uniref:DUF2188 domain-containing protein n=1 Tax=Shinella yambaruensis TaxID=415996 RepID=A0ABQ5ZUZ1_9HYPH|nr:hypothetical protein GCM10007923_64270 [Shinella yambaruensis]
MKTVTIRQCYGDHTEWTSTHRTDDDQVAIERAIKRRFGVRAAFYEDNGLSTESKKYGQIGHPTKWGNASMDTGRVSIRVE